MFDLFGDENDEEGQRSSVEKHKSRSKIEFENKMRPQKREVDRPQIEKPATR